MDPAQTVLAAGVTTVFHPLAYAKTLIQVGYEPLAPVPSTTLFGSKVLMYPNVLKYIGHIKKTEGFFGLYRGLAPRLLSNVVCTVVSNTISAELVGKPVGGVSSDSTAKNEAKTVATGINKLLKDTSYESLARCAGMVASQPFYVIAVRSMCQIVGQETKYSTITSSISEIWNNEGVMGFFSGLVPRLIGELLTIWLANILTHIINTAALPAIEPDTPDKADGNRGPRTYSSTFSQLVVTQLTYPFLVVSSVMTISDSGLMAATLSPGAKYSGWLDCWSRLSVSHQLKRGSGMFMRVYRGRSQVGMDGNLIPALEPF